MTQHLVTPRNVSWQEFQSARDEFNTTIATNKQEILDIQNDYEQENNAKFVAFQDELNTKFETVADAANRINDLDSDLLYVGQVLRVVDNNTDTNLDGLSCYGDNYKEVEYVLYRVVSGDSLYSISRRFGVSVDDLIKLNNLSSSNLSIGDVLKIREVN